MKLRIYAIRDNKAESFRFGPFTHRSRGEAIRDFSNACSKPGSQLFDHCEDYSLYEIGIWLADDATIEPYANNVLVISGILASKQHKEFYAAHELQVTESNMDDVQKRNLELARQAG